MVCSLRSHYLPRLQLSFNVMPSTDLGLSSHSRIFAHEIGSHAFVRRAQANLGRFLQGDPAALFYAALELRYAIEARLFEYIDGALIAARQPPRRIKEYSAEQLLRVLAEIDSSSDQEGLLVLQLEGSNEPAQAMRFIPMDRTFVTLYGRLGNLLHHTYFRSNPRWFVNVPAGDPPVGNLVSAHDLVQRGIDDLTRVLSGELLASPRLTEVVSHLNEGHDAGTDGSPAA